MSLQCHVQRGGPPHPLGSSHKPHAACPTLAKQGVKPQREERLVTLVHGSTISPGHQSSPFRRACRRLLQLPLLPAFLQLLDDGADPQDQQGTPMDHRVAGGSVHVLTLREVSATAALLLGLRGLLVRPSPRPTVYSLSISTASDFTG